MKIKNTLVTRIIAFGIFVLVFSLVYPYIFDKKLFLGGDNADYYILATAMAKGFGYVNYHLPEMPPANHFPPGYPFVMSLVMKLGVSSIIAMKYFNGIMLLLSSMLIFTIAKKMTKNIVLAIVIGVLVLLNSNLLEYSTIMMSEISFVFFSLLSVYFFLRLIEKENTANLKNINFYLMIACLIVDIYIRTQGVALLFAFLVYLGIQRNFKLLAVLFVGAILALAPWQIRSSNLGGSAYMKQIMRVDPYNNASEKMGFGDWLDRIGENSARYISKEIPNSLFPVLTVQYKDPQTGKNIPSPVSYWIVGIFVILFTLLGIWSLEKYRWFLLLLYASTFGIYLLWPQVWFGIRFILPMVPFTYLFGIVGIIHTLKLIFKKSAVFSLSNIYLAGAFGVLFFVQSTPIKNLHAKSNREHPRNWANFLKIGEWAKDNLPKTAVISNRKPGLIYTVSQLKTDGFLYTTDREAMINSMKDHGVTHVILEQLRFAQTGRYLYPLIQKEPDKYFVVKQYGAENRVDKKGNKVQPVNAAWLLEFKPELGYNGEYKDGIREGKGTYTFRNGSVITGVWVNDTLEGNAILEEPNGNIIKGPWVKGKKNGTFTIQQSNGNVIEAVWKNDIIEPIGYLLDKNGKRTSPIKLR